MFRRGPYKKYYSSNTEDIPRSTSYKRKENPDHSDKAFGSHESKQESIDSLQNLDFSELDASTDVIYSKDHSHTDSNRLFNTTHLESTFLVDDDYNSSTEETVTEKANNSCSKTTKSENENRFNSLRKEIYNGINVGEILLIFMNIMKKHSLSWTVVLDIFLALNFIFKKDILSVTKYMIKKLMKVNTDSVSYHVICQECKKYLGKHSELKSSLQCPCGNTVSSSSMGSFFIEIDIIHQLNNLFSNPVITNNLDGRFNRQKKNINNFEDIYDGFHYQNCLKNIGQDKWNFSYTFNTDGCRPAAKTTITAWPIFLMLHELPDFLRKKFMLLAGLWVAKVEPNMNNFLQPFVDTANHLSSIGFECSKDGAKKISKVFPLGCCVDSVARCAILNMKKFNGTYGCTFCEHPTVRIGRMRKYPMIENIPKKEPMKV